MSTKIIRKQIRFVSRYSSKEYRVIQLYMQDHFKIVRCAFSDGDSDTLFGRADANYTYKTRKIYAGFRPFSTRDVKIKQ